MRYVLVYTGSIWKKILLSRNLNYLLDDKLGIVMLDDALSGGGEEEADDGAK